MKCERKNKNQDKMLIIYLQQQRCKSREKAAGWLSRFFLCWLWPLMRVGNDLEYDDVKNALDPENAPNELRAKWNRSIARYSFAKKMKKYAKKTTSKFQKYIPIQKFQQRKYSKFKF